MRKICDLYVCEETRSSQLRFVRLFDDNFNCRDDVICSGYLNINVDRIKLVSLVSELRKYGVGCFSVPVEYRDKSVLSVGDALILAREGAAARGLSVSDSAREGGSPLFWMFDLIGEGRSVDGAGGCVMIDRIDGRVWSAAEYEEYMYDYNNIF